MSFLKHLPLAMRQTRERLRGNDVCSWCVRLLVLVSFTASSIGIPVGDWSLLGKSEDSTMTPWCRCSKGAKQSGTCCCAKSVAGATFGSCCSTRKQSASKTAACPTKTKPGGCCSEKMPEKGEVASKSAASRHDNPPASISACGCGPTDSPMLLFSTEPRILTKAFSLNGLDVCGDSSPALSLSPCGQRSRPLAPPPKSPFVG